MRCMQKQYYHSNSFRIEKVDGIARGNVPSLINCNYLVLVIHNLKANKKLFIKATTFTNGTI